MSKLISRKIWLFSFARELSLRRSSSRCKLFGRLGSGGEIPWCRARSARKTIQWIIILTFGQRKRTARAGRQAPVFRSAEALTYSFLRSIPVYISKYLSGNCIRCKEGPFGPSFAVGAVYFRCQILSLYSWMVRSEEKMPDLAVLVIAMRSHFSRFW